MRQNTYNASLKTLILCWWKCAAKFNLILIWIAAVEALGGFTEQHSQLYRNIPSSGF